MAVGKTDPPKTPPKQHYMVFLRGFRGCASHKNQPKGTPQNFVKTHKFREKKIPESVGEVSTHKKCDYFCKCPTHRSISIVLLRV